MKVKINGVNIILTPEQIKEIEAKKTIKSEQLFEELVKDIYVNDSTWYKPIFKHNVEHDGFWVDYKVWKKFYPFFNDDYEKVENFIKTQVEKHFNLKDVEPFNGVDDYNF